MKNVATIILNRNLPDATNCLVELIGKHDIERTDIFVIEAGSDEDNLSKYCTWWANDEDTMRHGLRVSRGFNYGLTKLLEEKRYDNYDYFFLMTNDSEFDDGPILEPLLHEMGLHPRMGNLVPCSRRWGERFLLKEETTRYFWHILGTVFLLRRRFIDMIREVDEPNFMNFLFDGTNFRGSSTFTELIIKGYANDWATGVTRTIWADENESYLRTRADLIKTEEVNENYRLYLEEDARWIRRKFGFNSYWSLNLYANTIYEQFFDYYPEERPYKI